MTSDDLLHQVMEDERGQQCMVGLSWIELPTADAMLSLMARAERTTRATAQNEVSSRSHAILHASAHHGASPHRSPLARTPSCRLQCASRRRRRGRTASSDASSRSSTLLALSGPPRRRATIRIIGSTALRSTKACSASRSASARSAPGTITCPSVARSSRRCSRIRSSARSRVPS
jgi:hypothetical protein